VGTCKNPNDGKSYVVSYNDCCGASTCGRCPCNRNEGNTERLLSQRNSLIAWCLGVAPNYHRTVTRVMTQG
jgi:methylamine dehydrogenase light chain